MKRSFLFLLAAVLLIQISRAEDWPSWRGPAGNGSLAAGKIPVKFSAESAAWKIELPGKGTSTPIVWQNRIYLTTPAKGQDAVIALDDHGKQLWIRELGAESRPRHKTLASSCNPSPVTDGKGLFVRFRSGTFAALELDGSVRWKLNLEERFGPEKLVWDTGSSMVLTERDVIVTRMHDGDSWIAGFDKASGKLNWQVKRNYEVPNENNNGYTTPVFFDYKGQRAFLSWGADHVTAHDASNGAMLWEVGGFNPRGTQNWPAIATPVIVGNIAVIPVGRDDRGQGSMQGIRITAGIGDAEARRAWKRDDIGIFCCSPVEYQGAVYLLRHRGEIVRINPATGKTDWTAQLPPVQGRAKTAYYASPTIVNGVMVVAREDGVVFTGKIGDQFVPLGENPMGERIVATPVPLGDRLLLRGDQHLFCIGAQ